MARMQLFELEDMPWLPASLRDTGTDFLRTLMALAKPYARIVPRLAQAVEASGATSIIDLCSGGGGPIGHVRKGLLEAGCPVPLTMSDLYPNPKAFAHVQRRAGQGVDFIAEPVDATAVPEHLSGFRTLFTSFHHFAPRYAAGILQDAVQHRRGIGIFEITERAPASFLLAFANIFLVLLMAPFTRPFRWSRLFWTYLPPVTPLYVWWDGFASIFRSYTVDELRAMVDGLAPNDYVWQIGREPTRPTRITYLIGYPKPR